MGGLTHYDGRPSVRRHFFLEGVVMEDRLEELKQRAIQLAREVGDLSGRLWKLLDDIQKYEEQHKIEKGNKQ
jgi:hypothetical protein